MRPEHLYVTRHKSANLPLTGEVCPSELVGTRD